MIKCLQLKRRNEPRQLKCRNEPRRGDHQNLRPDLKIARLAWSPHFNNPGLRKISKYRTQTQDSLKLASDLTRRKNRKKSASKLLTLRNILSIGSKTQGSMGPCVQQTGTEWIKDAEVVKPASYLSTQEPRLKIKHGHEPALVVHIQKGAKS